MIRTLEDARQALVAHIQRVASAWEDYPLVVEYYNTKVVNTASQVNPYLKVDLMLLDGWQLSLGDTESYRVSGVVKLDAMVKEGSGMAEANKLLETFVRATHMKDSIYPLRLHAASFYTTPPKLGWVSQSASIPFWFDSIQEP